jgi:hypothetical protein
MANDFYQHSGHPGTRAPRSSALLRAEFAAIEDGFDKLPAVSTANLFAVTDGSALVGKTAVQSKVILSLSNVPDLDTTAAVAHTPLTNNPHSVTATQVGLGNCDNTADLDKPISTLAQAALDLKAGLESPALTGNPTAPTQASADNSTKVATTAYVKSLFAGGTGYRYINGTLVQAATSVSNTSTPTIAFPVAFPNSVTCVVFAVADLDPGDLRISTAASDLTKVGFVRTGATAMRINIIAWGY